MTLIKLVYMYDGLLSYVQRTVHTSARLLIILAFPYIHVHLKIIQ